jgi:hypothetical protein
LISIAGQVLEALSRHGNIALVSSPNEQKVLLEQAATTPLVRYMTNGERLSWAGYDVKLHESGLLICCSGESLPFAELKLPRTGDRGRQVCVLAAWRLGEGIPVLNKTLGALYPLRDASRPAREKVVEILNQAREQGKQPVSFWIVDLHPDVAVDQSLQATISAASLAYSHSFEVNEADGVSTPSFVFTPSCANCHVKAYEHWRNTRHSRAMMTLKAIGRSADARCTPCHTDQMDVTHTSHSVTCAACHSKSSSPTDACAKCHTSITDPNRNYAKQLGTICPGGTEQTGECEQRLK